MLRSERGRPRGLGLSIVLLALALPGPGRAVAQSPTAESKAWFAENYTKHEVRIPMRDGVRLFTLVYTPKDTTKTYPILLKRTPYNLKPYTVDAGDWPASYLPESYLSSRRRG